MKNITVSVDDDTYRLARIRAAERDTSLSALVKQYLSGLAEDASAFERLANEEKEVRARVKDFCAADRLPRDKLHERG
jgi:plasmid stability protein